MSWVNLALRTWIGVGIMVLAFVGLAVLPDGQKTPALIAAAVGWSIVILDVRVKDFAARFPRWLGAALMLVGFAIAYSGASVLGPGRYLEIMGTALCLLAIGYLFLRRGH